MAGADRSTQMSEWAEWTSDDVCNQALACCKGEYQRNLVLGFENLSGSTLKGKAKQWGGRYAASRAALLARLRAAGVQVSERRAEHGRRILVLG